MPRKCCNWTGRGEEVAGEIVRVKPAEPVSDENPVPSATASVMVLARPERAAEQRASLQSHVT